MFQLFVLCSSLVVNSAQDLTFLSLSLKERETKLQIIISLINQAFQLFVSLFNKELFDLSLPLGDKGSTLLPFPHNSEPMQADHHLSLLLFYPLFLKIPDTIHQYHCGYTEILIFENGRLMRCGRSWQSVQF